MRDRLTIGLASGGRMMRIALAFALLLLSAPALSAGTPGSGDELERLARPPGIARSAYDLAVLRPLGFLQVVVGAAILVPSYPVALLVGGDEDVWRACVAEPVERTFRRPLGRL
jgi:hypothetical protein